MTPREIIAKAILDAMDLMDGLDATSADTYADAALVALRAAGYAVVPREHGNWLIPTPEGKAIMERRKPLYMAMCEASDCKGRGFNAMTCGQCAACADEGDYAIEAYFENVLAASEGGE